MRDALDIIHEHLYSQCFIELCKITFFFSFIAKPDRRVLNIVFYHRILRLLRIIVRYAIYLYYLYCTCYILCFKFFNKPCRNIYTVTCTDNPTVGHFALIKVNYIQIKTLAENSLSVQAPPYTYSTLSHDKKQSMRTN